MDEVKKIINDLKNTGAEATEFNKILNQNNNKLMNYIIEYNLPIVAYKRNGKIFYFGLNTNLTLNQTTIIKQILDNKIKNNETINIVNFSHSNWHYKNGIKIMNNESNSKKERIHSLKNDADFFVYNVNIQKSAVVPTINGMNERSKEEGGNFNKLLGYIDNYCNEKGKVLQKNISYEGSSIGVPFCIKTLKNLNSEFINNKDKINISLESMPNYYGFIISPKEYAKDFIEAISNKDVYDMISTIKIGTNLSKKYHNYSNVYDFLNEVCKYFIYNDDISEKQINEFYGKLEIQEKLKDKCENIFKNAKSKKEKWQKMSEKEKISNTKLEGKNIILCVFLAIITCFIALLFISSLKEKQYKENKKKYKILKINKQNPTPKPQKIIDGEDIKPNIERIKEPKIEQPYDFKNINNSSISTQQSEQSII